MTASWLWARAELRSRWRSWVVLGVLAGCVFGLAAAGVAGARRTSVAVPRYVTASAVANRRCAGQRPVVRCGPAACGGGAPRSSRDVSVPGCRRPAGDAFGARQRPAPARECGDGEADGRRDRRGPDAESRARGRSSGRPERRTSTAPPDRLDDHCGPVDLSRRRGGCTTRNDPCRRSRQLPRSPSRRRHREVGIARRELVAVERLVHGVPVASRRLREPVRGSAARRRRPASLPAGRRASGRPPHRHPELHGSRRSAPDPQQHAHRRRRPAVVCAGRHHRRLGAGGASAFAR